MNKNKMIESLVQSAMRDFKNDVTILKSNAEVQTVNGIIVALDNEKFYGKISINNNLVIMNNPMFLENESCPKLIKVKVNGQESNVNQLIFSTAGFKCVYVVDGVIPQVTKNQNTPANSSNPNPDEKSFEVLNGAPTVSQVPKGATKSYDIISPQYKQ